MADLVFRVNGFHYDMENSSGAILIDSSQKGIEDPDDKRELIIIRTGINRTAFFRNQDWLVQGTIKHGCLTLFHDEFHDL